MVSFTDSVKKSPVKYIILIAIALLVWSLCLAKHLDPAAGLAIKGANMLTLTLPNVPHISQFLNGCQYQCRIHITIAIGFVVVLATWRIWTLRRSWRSLHHGI